MLASVAPSANAVSVLPQRSGLNADTAKSSPADTGARGELSPEQKKQVSELQRIDAKVREHEAAHLRAGRGVVTSGASFSFTYGPDGKAYAVAGEVGISLSPERDPQASIQKAQAIQAAALAPADPSAQDYSVAQAGRELETRAYRELDAKNNAPEEAGSRPANHRQQAQADAYKISAQPGANLIDLLA